MADESDLLAQYPWINIFDVDDRREMYQEIRSGLQRGVPLPEILRDWHTTALAVSDPGRRAVLSGEVDCDDFVEVSRPCGDRPL